MVIRGNPVPILLCNWAKTKKRPQRKCKREAPSVRLNRMGQHGVRGQNLQEGYVPCPVGVLRGKKGYPKGGAGLQCCRGEKCRRSQGPFEVLERLEKLVTN